MAQLIDKSEAKAFISELGFSIPDSVLELLIEQVGKHDACLSQYGNVTAKLLSLYAVARLASLSGARKISSQGSPSGASRSFTYDNNGTDYLLTQIRAWDKNNCLSDLPLDSGRVGFFAVVGGCNE
ncbi:hypothetical protein J3U11_06865 [Gilliamella sp. B2840]|uniref:DUF7370 family protein n=1 Tax=Gilliamella sp. B2840 TaxID=2817975 RepID=UPI002269F677|nr:hypothetical protein [Gilliamella sp. B2840]MCX8700788.1 hypothetical protein [Gilliamella sp. B2840]